MAEQMLEMQRQQVAQTTILNAYLQQALIPHAPPMYPHYQSQGYEFQHKGEEDDLYSYASLDRPEAPFWRNDGMDPSQYPYHGYNVKENYENPNIPPEYSQEPETSQGSSVFDQLRSRPPTNRRESSISRRMIRRILSPISRKMVSTIFSLFMSWIVCLNSGEV
ncbi:hypothetical protein Fot_32747 [Forsythia ovata]|uniref:Uncharacterized protein n=1 Tax=Forsythia ovata TaxID=205694 RepID=A0ABD1T8Q3_9LAMI